MISGMRSWISVTSSLPDGAREPVPSLGLTVEAF
jgi:hypothetical protein